MGYQVMSNEATAVHLPLTSSAVNLPWQKLKKNGIARIQIQGTCVWKRVC